MQENLVRLDSVSYTYTRGSSSIHALRGASFSLRTGEYVAVVGPSGSGKSTFLKVMAGIVPPQKGHVSFFRGMSPEKFRRHVGFVFQNFSLVSYQTVLQNVRSPLVYSSIPFWKHSAIAQDALARVGLADRARSFPDNLSGGQMQRVAIARALVRSPKLIIADEPTGNLDHQTGEKILDIFDEQHKSGVAVVVVTHRSQVLDRCGQALSLIDGIFVDERVPVSP